MDDFRPFNLAQIYQSADASVANAMQSNLLVLQSQKMKQDFDEENALKALARSSLSTDASGAPSFDLRSFARRAYAIDPMKALSFETTANKSDLETQKITADIAHTKTETEKAKGDIAKQQHEEAVQLARGLLSADPKDMPTLYPQMRQQAIDMGHEGAKKLPEQWDPLLLPKLKALAFGDMSSKDAADKAEYRQALDGTQPPVVPATGAAPRAAPASNVPSSAADMSADQENHAFDLAHAAPTREVVDKAPVQTPEGLRAQAQAARAKGTKAGFDVAKDLETAANQLESRILEEQKLAENTRLREEQINLRRQNQGQNAKTNAAKLSDDFRQEPAVKDYRTVQPLVASMENAAKMKTAASDLDMVYAIAKIFDPGSVVREGEQVMIVNAGGLPSRLQSIIGSLNGGQKLSDTLRKELLDQAHSRTDNYKQAYDSAAASYRAQAQRWELNPDDIVRDYKVTSREAAVPTAVNPKTGEKLELRNGKWTPPKAPRALQKPGVRVSPEDVQGTPLQ